MNYIEFFAIVFSLISVVLTIRKSIYCWLTGILSAVFYILVLLDKKLYGSISMHSIFLIQNFYGWFNWKKNLKEDSITIIKLTKTKFYTHMFFVGIIWFLISESFKRYSDNPFSYTDSFVFVVSLMANFYLSKRVFENWYLWIVSDIVFVWIFMSNEMYPSAFLYFTFLLMATYGMFLWKRDLKTD